MKKQIYIKKRKRRSDEFQFFMHNFVDECIEAGFQPIPDLFASYKWHLRAICRRLLYIFFRIIRPFRNPQKKALIVTANGGTINDNVFPYLWRYEIIPMLWDNWPFNYSSFLESAKLFNIKTVFVTSSQVTERINNETNIQAYWIPEGIPTSLYLKGAELKDREKDVLELGRQMTSYHGYLVKMAEQEVIKLTSSSVLANGLKNDKKLLYESDEEMAMDIARHKVFVCFPQCDTTPERAGNIETITQRYWEGMLSRCILVGRAPRELINLIGYNPVIDIDWDNPSDQLYDILENVSFYQPLVNKNFDAAMRLASWNGRIDTIKTKLCENGYVI